MNNKLPYLEKIHKEIRLIKVYDKAISKIIDMYRGNNHETAAAISTAAIFIFFIFSKIYFVTILSLILLPMPIIIANKINKGYEKRIEPIKLKKEKLTKRSLMNDERFMLEAYKEILKAGDEDLDSFDPDVIEHVLNEKKKSLSIRKSINYKIAEIETMESLNLENKSEMVNE